MTNSISAHDSRHDSVIIQCLKLLLPYVLKFRKNYSTFECADIGCGYVLPYSDALLFSLAESNIKHYTLYLVDPELSKNKEEAQDHIDHIKLFSGADDIVIYPNDFSKFFNEKPFKILDLIVMIQTSSLFTDEEIDNLFEEASQSESIIINIVELNDKVTSDKFKQDMNLHQHSLEWYIFKAVSHKFEFVKSIIMNAHNEQFDGQLMAGMAFRFNKKAPDYLDALKAITPDLSEKEKTRNSLYFGEHIREAIEIIKDRF